MPEEKIQRCMAPVYSGRVSGFCSKDMGHNGRCKTAQGMTGMTAEEYASKHAERPSEATTSRQRFAVAIERIMENVNEVVCSHEAANSMAGIDSSEEDLRDVIAEELQRALDEGAAGVH